MHLVQRNAVEIGVKKITVELHRLNLKILVPLAFFAPTEILSQQKSNGIIKGLNIALTDGRHRLLTPAKSK